mgnify:CR=1 FL=1
MIFRISQINFSRIHLKYTSIIRSIHILGDQMKMQVRKFVTIRSVIYFFRMESLVHGTGHTGNICHKCVTFFITQFKQVVYMIFISNKATSAIGLFLKKEYT